MNSSSATNSSVTLLVNPPTASLPTVNEGVDPVAFLAAATNNDLPGMLFHTFGVGAPTPWLAVPSGALSLISLLGILMNSSVVYVTLASKNLRGTCQFLLAVTCLGEVLHQMNHFIFFVVTTVGGNFIQFGLCLYLQTPSVFGLYCVQIALTCTALDRFFSAFTPILYKQLNDYSKHKLAYLVLCSAVIVAFGAFVTLYTDVVLQKYTGSKCTCDIADIVNTPDSYPIFIYSVLGLNTLAVALYLSVWLTIQKNLSDGDVQKKLLRSLMTIVGVNIGGYIVNLGLMCLYKMTLQNNFHLLWALFMTNGCALNICAAANAPILYWMSSEYRSAYDRYLLPAFHCWTRRWVTTTPTETLTIQRRRSWCRTPQGGGAIPTTTAFTSSAVGTRG